jgi:transcriptional regulator with XRE-family HTH domain
MIADRVAELRRRSGLSLRLAARLSGLHDSHVCHLEKGRRPKPTDETIVKLCVLWGSSRGWLRYGEGRPPTNDQLCDAVYAAWVARFPSEDETVISKLLEAVKPEKRRYLEWLKRRNQQ